MVRMMSSYFRVHLDFPAVAGQHHTCIIVQQGTGSLHEVVGVGEYSVC